MDSNTDKNHSAAILNHHSNCLQIPTSTTQSTAACMWRQYQLNPAYHQSSNNNYVYNTPTTINTPRSNRSICHLVTLLTTITILLVLDNSIAGASPQSCILCDKEDLKAKDPSTNYEEFLFEHQVTRQDAINALKSLNDSFYVGPSPDNSCKSVSCNKRVMQYCLGPQFINDHCWCELGHTDEGLPFVPHICYVGEKVYTASVGSCFFYEEVKECCCAPALAKQWRHISGASHQLRNSSSWLLHLVLIILFVAGHSL